VQHDRLFIAPGSDVIATRAVARIHATISRIANDERARSRPGVGRSRGDVGIWDETYLVRGGAYACVYSGMPKFGLGRVGNHVPVVGSRESASSRIDSDIDATQPDAADGRHWQPHGTRWDRRNPHDCQAAAELGVVRRIAAGNPVSCTVLRRTT
jgi:hypothetical protein